MRLREYLVKVGTGYRAADGFETPQQALLLRAREELVGIGPTDFVIRASGGQRPLRATHTPWIGFFDPDESTTPQQGLYVVWILTKPADAWTLSVNMGTEKRAELMKRYESDQTTVPLERRVLASLRAEATAIRSRMPPNLVLGWDTSINLKSNGFRQRRYEAATIIGRTYPLEDLPDPDALEADFGKICLALQEAVRAKRDLALAEPGAVSTPTPPPVPEGDRPAEFNPGEDRETKVKMPNRPIIRRPRHEAGLRRYGEWLQSRGMTVATNVYPRDFTIAGTPGWLGEYKVIYGLDVVGATRAALSQLKEYRHFLYAQGEPPGLLAVFSGPIGDRRVSWLNAEGIAVVWQDGAQWRGCQRARAAGLAL